MSARIPTRSSIHIDAALLVGRVLMVAALIPNGLRKIATFAQTAAGMGGTPQMIDGRPFPDQTPLIHFPLPELFLGASLVFDLLGAALIIVGWRTRAVGTFLAGYVLIAMTIYHSDIRHAMDFMHILRNLPFLAGLLILGAVGGGRWSLDGLAERRREAIT
ncbi:MAG TPA: DoxX family protein [Lautropia sp.]|nr:DoxX family protein [Lautropia sp.]